MEERPESTIDTDELFRIMKLMEESDWDEIELTTKSFKLVVGKKRPPDSGGAPAHAPGPFPLRQEKSPPAGEAIGDGKGARSGRRPEARAGERPKSGTELKGTPINAPMMGTFYRAPSPGAPPFVEVGDTVTEHTIVGIIEVMKVMSSLESGLRGRVLSIVAENGQLVQYNEPLMLIDCGDSVEDAHE